MKENLKKAGGLVLTIAIGVTVAMLTSNWLINKMNQPVPIADKTKAA